MDTKMQAKEIKVENGARFAEQSIIVLGNGKKCGLAKQGDNQINNTQAFSNDRKGRRK
eukprot:TRINITY_DN3062_c0_g1_i1.p2 TRINITY_DN3062_c0_g1~~TRINITY_DN3062_c0_g1_i1.p2  ORF type:complete len:58 (-),score=15.28 TRINITY_DN3062_c0_g1_i1:79-252(-)